MAGGVTETTPNEGESALTECSDFIGELFTLEGVTYVCLNAEKGAPMSTTTSSSAASLTYLMTNQASNVITAVAANANSIVIKTSYHTFSQVQMVDGVHAFEVDTNMKCVEDTLDSGTVTTAANIKLFNCVENDCKETFGYVLIGGTYYVSKVTGVSAVFNAAEKTACDSGAIGGLATLTTARKRTTVVNFCLAENIGVAINTDPTVDDVNYVMANGGSTIFTSASATAAPFLVIKSTANAFVLNNVMEAGTYYAEADTNQIDLDINILISNELQSKTYQCNADGTCSRNTETLLNAGKNYLIGEKVYAATAGTKGIVLTAGTDTGIYLFNIKGTLPVNISNFVSEVTDVTENLLYTCRSGVCYPTAGYFKYSTNHLAECSTSGCVENTENVVDTAPSCSSGNVGKAYIVSNNLKLCIVPKAATVGKPELTAITGGFLISYDGDKYFVFNSNTNAVAFSFNGYYLVGDNALVSGTSTDGILLECSVGTNQQVCNVVEKSALHHGYYVNAAYPIITDAEVKPYIICTGSSTTCKLITTDTNCSGATAGNLCKDTNDHDIVKVLIKSTDVVAGFITDPEEDDVYYIMSNADGNAFLGEGGNNIIIRATTNAIIIHQIEDGVHAIEVDATDNSIIEDELGSQGTVTTEGNLHLYLCEANVCTETYGYVVIGTNYYTVSKEPTSASLSDLEGSCTEEEDRGKLYKASDVLLCLDHTGSKSTQKIDATGDPANYLMENVANNAFTYTSSNNDKYIVIMAAPNAIVHNTKITASGGIYATDKNDLVNLEDGCDETKELVKNYYYVCTAGLCTQTASGVTSTTSVVYLAMLGNTNILCSAVVINDKIIFSPLDTTDIVVAPATATKDAVLYEVKSNLAVSLTENEWDIYECVNGSCTSADGYFMFGESDSEDIADCKSTSGECAASDSINCDDDNHLGKPNINDSKALTLCVNVGGTKTKASLGKNGLKYYSGSTTATTYSRYKSDSTGRVIVLSTPEAGYYIIDNSEENLGDLVSTADAEGILILCDDENSCTEVTDVGYYKNKGDVDGTVPFIQCTSDGKCKAIAVPSLVACNANNIGLLDKNGKICVSGEGLEIAINEDATSTDYLVTGASASNIFTEEATVNSFILTMTAGSITLKSGLTDGVKAFEFNDTDYSVASITLGSASTDTVVMAKLRLYMCESNICFRTYGYVLIGSNYYTVSRKGTINSKGRSEIESTCTSTSKIGSLHKNANIFVCLNYTNAAVLPQQIDAVGAKNYIMPNVAENVFTNPETTEDDSYIILLAGDNAVLLNVLYERKGNYLVKTDQEILTAVDTPTSLFITCETDAANEYTCTKLTTITNGYYIHGIVGTNLISCTDNSCQLKASSAGYYGGALNNLIKCGASCGDPPTPAIGYYVNKDAGETEHPYIECSTETHCELIETPGEATGTCAIGHLITHGGKAKLCLDGNPDHSQGFTDSSEKNFLLSYHASSLFVSKIPNGFAGVIKITTTEMFIDETVDDNRCVSTTTLQVTDKDGETDCTSGTTAYEHCSNGICSSSPTAPSCVPKTGDFCTENTDYICTDEEGTTLSTATPYTGFLYQCVKANEPCQPYTNVGFLISNEKLYSCWNDANSGPPSIKCKQSDLPTTNCSSTSVGTIVKDASDPAKFALCLDYNGTTPVAITLTKTAHVMLKYTTANGNTFGLSNTQYALVKVDETTVTLNNEYEDDYGYMYIYAKKADYSILEKGTTCLTKVEGVYPLLEFDCEKGICQETSS